MIRRDNLSFEKSPVNVHDELCYSCTGEGPWEVCQVMKLRSTRPMTYRIQYPPWYRRDPGMKFTVVQHAQLFQLRRPSIPKRMPNEVLDLIAERGYFVVGGRSEVIFVRDR